MGLLLVTWVPAVVDVHPDVDAFVGGVELGLSATFIAIAFLAGVAVFRRIVN